MASMPSIMSTFFLLHVSTKEKNAQSAQKIRRDSSFNGIGSDFARRTASKNSTTATRYSIATRLSFDVCNHLITKGLQDDT